MSAPDWVTPGGYVAVVQGYANDAFSLVRVERLTATQIVLENGDRYPIKTLRKSTGSFSGSKTLEDPNSPRVVRGLRLQQAKHIAFEIDRATRSLSLTSTDDQFEAVGKLALRLAEKMGVQGMSAKEQGQAESVAALSEQTGRDFLRILATAPEVFSVNDLRRELDLAQIPEKARGGLFAGAVAAGYIVPLFTVDGYPRRVASLGGSAHRAPVREYRRAARAEVAA